MLKSVAFFALGIIIALLGLIVLSLAVAGCTVEDADTPAASTPTVAGPAGSDTQPAPTDASQTVTVDPPTAAPEPTSTPSEAASRDYQIVTLLAKDAIPAILEPDFLVASEANEQMKEDELVLGVSLDGDARAYSVNLLSRHEIVNDVVGGRPVAVTW